MSNQSVIKYHPSFKKTDLVRTKLKTVTLKVEELCVTFDTGEIKTMLYVIEDFHIAMDTLAVNRTDFESLKQYFKKTLGHGPAKKFKKMVVRTYFTDTTLQQVVIESWFEKAMKAFIKLYYTSTDPKGDLIEYLKTDKRMKPKEKSVINHQDRM